MEADLAWVMRGGADPRRWLERYRGRIPLVQCQGHRAPAGEKEDEDGWADIGTGIVPWFELSGRCALRGRRLEIMVAEHDNPSDFHRYRCSPASARRSHARLHKVESGDGRAGAHARRSCRLRQYLRHLSPKTRAAFATSSSPPAPISTLRPRSGSLARRYTRSTGEA